MGAPELAFVRAWAEGLDLSAAWARFLGDGSGAGDVRRARADLRQLREQLAQLARSHGRPDLSVLLRRDPEAMADPRQSAPSLDAFRELQPPDFYSEDELLALYESTHGRVDARSAARRRQRLRERLVLAVQWLGRQVLRAPVPADPVAAWLDERLAARLDRVGITTLQELQQWIATRGRLWHRPVPRVGAVAAQRVTDWLADHAATLGPPPATASWPRHALVHAGRSAAAAEKASARPAAHDPQRSFGTASGDVDASGPTDWPAPLERFVAPPSLDGRDGQNRARREDVRIAASTDAEAIQAWLARWPVGDHTWRSYRKEAERLWVWAVLRRGRALSSLDASDLQAYGDFLRQPDAAWCAPRSTPRWSPAWRPLERGLSARSTMGALAVLRSMFGWLAAQRYLEHNPLEEIAVGRVADWVAPQPGAQPVEAAPSARVEATAGAFGDAIEAGAVRPDDPVDQAASKKVNPTVADMRLQTLAALLRALPRGLELLATARLSDLGCASTAADTASRQGPDDWRKLRDAAFANASPDRMNLEPQWFLVFPARSSERRIRQGRAVNLPKDVVKLLGAYLAERAARATPVAPVATLPLCDASPLISRLDADAALSAGQLRRLMREGARQARGG